MVFINGIHNEALSSTGGLPKGVVVQDLSQALMEKDHKEIVYRYLSKWAMEEESSFKVLNTAFAQSGIYIYVPDGTIVDRPIHLLNIAVDSDDKVIISPQRLAIIGENSQLTLLESYYCKEGNEQDYFTNVVNQFVIKRNAHMNHYKLQNEGHKAFFINNTEVEQERDSTFSSYAVDLGGKTVRNNLNAILKDSGVTTNFYGVYLGNGQQHIDNQTFVDHAYPHCNSNELYKGILTDKAKGVFNGKVVVRPDAQKTNAFQQNNSLVLSKTATMNSKPQLEIYADDVKCSHGATIGQLDEEAIYYLQSRGLDDTDARSMLQTAFLHEVTELIKIEPIREKVDRLVGQKLNTI